MCLWLRTCLPTFVPNQLKLANMRSSTQGSRRTSAQLECQLAFCVQTLQMAARSWRFVPPTAASRRLETMAPCTTRQLASLCTSWVSTSSTQRRLVELHTGRSNQTKRAACSMEPLTAPTASTIVQSRRLPGQFIVEMWWPFKWTCCFNSAMSFI